MERFLIPLVTKKVKLSKEVIAEKVKKALEIVDLAGFEKRNISTLSYNEM